MLKLGAAPFHGWFISILKRSSILILMLLSTLQKCIPLVIVANFNISPYIMGPFLLTTLSVTFFRLPGTIRINKILALSSIVNLGWFLVGVQHSLKVFFRFFTIYVILLLRVVTLCTKHSVSSFRRLISLRLMDKVGMVFVFISLGGLPPLLGFLGKLLILKSSLMYFNFIIMLVLVYRSLLVLYTYISRLFFIITSGPTLKVGLKNSKISIKTSIFCGSLARFNMMMIIPM